MIIYKKGDLFKEAPSNAMLLHACNCQGVWGSGIAKTMKEKFPEEFRLYQKYAHDMYQLMAEGEVIVSDAVGTALITNRVVSLFTSINYGSKVSSPENILIHTKNALEDLVKKTPCLEFHLPKINSGLFKVPWEETEKILNEYTHIKFYVYELE